MPVNIQAQDQGSDRPAAETVSISIPLGADGGHLFDNDIDQTEWSSVETRLLAPLETLDQDQCLQRLAPKSLSAPIPCQGSWRRRGRKITAKIRWIASFFPQKNDIRKRVAEVVYQSNISLLRMIQTELADVSRHSDLLKKRLHSAEATVRTLRLIETSRRSKVPEGQANAKERERINGTARSSIYWTDELEHELGRNYLRYNKDVFDLAMGKSQLAPWIKKATRRAKVHQDSLRNKAILRRDESYAIAMVRDPFAVPFIKLMLIQIKPRLRRPRRP